MVGEKIQANLKDRVSAITTFFKSGIDNTKTSVHTEIDTLKKTLDHAKKLELVKATTTLVGDTIKNTAEGVARREENVKWFINKQADITRRLVS